MCKQLPPGTPSPLVVEEVIACLRTRWQASYDMQLVVRRKRLYLQVMWAGTGHNSFWQVRVTTVSGR